MTVSKCIDALLSLYEQLRDAGQPVSPSTLCEADPDLLGPVSERIAALDAGALLLDSRSTIDQNTQTAILNLPTLPTVPGYEVLRLLGEGGMGVVYLGRHLALDRLVALKTIPAGGATPNAQARMRQPRPNSNERTMQLESEI